MNLRTKTLAFVVLSTAALVGATAWVVDGLVLSALARVEREEAARRVDDVRALVLRCAEEYGDSFADWTEWDDMARFLADGNQAFVASNISLAALSEQIHADQFVVVREDGSLVHATQVDAARAALEPCSEEFLAHLDERGLLRPGEAWSGLLAFPERTCIVSSRPIHTTAGRDGSARGRLVTARWLDDEWIRRLERFTLLEIDLARTAETPLEEEELEAREALAGGAPSFVAETSEERISGYGLLQDIYRKPALVLRVERSRGVRTHGREIASWTMLTLVSCGLVLGLVALWATGRAALKPLQRLRKGAHRLQRGESARVILHSSDEFQELAHEFNRMSDAVALREELLEQALADVREALEREGYELAPEPGADGVPRLWLRRARTSQK